MSIILDILIDNNFKKIYEKIKNFKTYEFY